MKKSLFVLNQIIEGVHKSFDKVNWKEAKMEQLNVKVKFDDVNGFS